MSYSKAPRPRAFTLKLSETDVKRLYETAYVNNTTPENIITRFVCDLVHGTYTNGPDEREMAIRYLARCSYATGSEKDFPAWLIENACIDELADALEVHDAMDEEIVFCCEHPDLSQETDIKSAETCKNGAEKAMHRWHDKYIADGGKQPYADAITAARQYITALTEAVTGLPKHASRRIPYWK